MPSLLHFLLRNTFLDVIKLSGFCLILSLVDSFTLSSLSYSFGSKINSLQTEFCVILQIFSPSFNGFTQSKGGNKSRRNLTEEDGESVCFECMKGVEREREDEGKRKSNTMYTKQTTPLKERNIEEVGGGGHPYKERTTVTGRTIQSFNYLCISCFPVQLQREYTRRGFLCCLSLCIHDTLSLFVSMQILQQHFLSYETSSSENHQDMSLWVYFHPSL